MAGLSRYDVLDHIPGGEELRMCLLVKTSLGRIRRWRQDQCQVHIGSFVDPNTLNLDPDSEFWPNLDPDPGLC